MDLKPSIVSTQTPVHVDNLITGVGQFLKNINCISHSVTMALVSLKINVWPVITLLHPFQWAWRFKLFDNVISISACNCTCIYFLDKLVVGQYFWYVFYSFVTVYYRETSARPPGQFGMRGEILNTNTIDQFKTCDKKEIISRIGDKVSEEFCEVYIRY